MKLRCCFMEVKSWPLLSMQMIETCWENLISTARKNLITDLDGTVSAGHPETEFRSSEPSGVCICNEQTAAREGRQNWQWK